MSAKINFEFYVVAKATLEPAREYARSKSLRTTVKKPALRADEVAVFVSMDLPIGLFRKPTLQVKIDVPGGDNESIAITPELADDIASLLLEQRGIRMTVVADPPTPKENTSESTC